MKIILYSDLHVSHRNKDYMTFLELTSKWLFDLVEKEKPDVLVNLGDTTDTYGMVDLRDAVWARNFLTTLGCSQESRGGKHWVLRGNHDTADKDGMTSSTQLMDGPATWAITKPGVWEHRGVRFLMLPHTKDISVVEKAIEEAQAGYEVVGVFAHLDWVGCRLTPTFISPEGLQPGYVAEKLPSVPVFAGHYHSPMQVGPVRFVGSPLYMNFSDEVGDIPRGVLQWDTDKIIVQRLENPHTYKCWTVEAKTEKELAKKMQQFEGQEAKSRVRIYVPKKLLDKAKELAEGFLWWGVYPMEGEKQSVDFVASVSLKTTPADAVQKAVDTAPEELDRKVLRNMGLEVFGVK